MGDGVLSKTVVVVALAATLLALIGKMTALAVSGQFSRLTANERMCKILPNVPRKENNEADS
jgi:hypothetical protein